MDALLSGRLEGTGIVEGVVSPCMMVLVFRMAPGRSRVVAMTMPMMVTMRVANAMVVGLSGFLLC